MVGGGLNPEKYSTFLLIPKSKGDYTVLPKLYVSENRIS
jgi:hypothetical protein